MKVTKKFAKYVGPRRLQNVRTHNTPQGLWFRRKLFGWGWTPTTWQGWLVIAVYLFAVLGFSLTIDAHSPAREILFTFILPVTLLTVALIRICYRKGERPRWQWGIPKEGTELDRQQ